MIPYMMITDYIIENAPEVEVKKIEENFNVKIKGADIIKLLTRLRAKLPEKSIVYIPDKFIIREKI